MKRRLLKFAAAATLALSVGAVMTALIDSGRTVRITYTAPPGPLEVTLRDGEGHFLRRTSFDAAAFRAHEVRLPEGGLEVELRLGSESRRVEALIMPETEGLELAWPR